MIIIGCCIVLTFVITIIVTIQIRKGETVTGSGLVKRLAGP